MVVVGLGYDFLFKSLLGHCGFRLKVSVQTGTRPNFQVRRLARFHNHLNFDIFISRWMFTVFIYEEADDYQSEVHMNSIKVLESCDKLSSW